MKFIVNSASCWDLLHAKEPVLQNWFFLGFDNLFFQPFESHVEVSVCKLVATMKNVVILLLMVSASVLGAPKATKCIEDGKAYDDGQLIPNDDPCKDCYCSTYQGIADTVCAVSDCGFPDPSMNCVQLPTAEDQCCPEFDCPGDQ